MIGLATIIAALAADELQLEQRVRRDITASRGWCPATRASLIELCESVSDAVIALVEYAGGVNDPDIWDRLHTTMARRWPSSFVSMGMSRAVFRLCPGLVLKVGLTGEGREAIMSEALAWKKLPEPLRSDFFVPVVAADSFRGRWLVMEEAQSSDIVSDEDLFGRMGELEKLQQDETPWMLTRSYEPDFSMNWGVHDGKPKVIDYQW